MNPATFLIVRENIYFYWKWLATDRGYVRMYAIQTGVGSNMEVKISVPCGFKLDGILTIPEARPIEFADAKAAIEHYRSIPDPPDEDGINTCRSKDCDAWLFGLEGGVAHSFSRIVAKGRFVKGCDPSTKRKDRTYPKQGYYQPDPGCGSLFYCSGQSKDNMYFDSDSWFRASAPDRGTIERSLFTADPPPGVPHAPTDPLNKSGETLIVIV